MKLTTQHIASKQTRWGCRDTQSWKHETWMKTIRKTGRKRGQDILTHTIRQLDI